MENFQNGRQWANRLCSRRSKRVKMRFFGVYSVTTGFGEFHLITKLVRFIEDYKVGTKFGEKKISVHAILDFAEFSHHRWAFRPKNFFWGGCRPPKPPHDPGGSPPRACGVQYLYGAKRAPKKFFWGALPPKPPFLPGRFVGSCRLPLHFQSPP